MQPPHRLSHKLRFEATNSNAKIVRLNMNMGSSVDTSILEHHHLTHGQKLWNTAIMKTLFFLETIALSTDLTRGQEN